MNITVKCNSFLHNCILMNIIFQIITSVMFCDVNSPTSLFKFTHFPKAMFRGHGYILG